jgi:hypothetical protein
VQIHCSAGGPFRSQERLGALASDIRAVDGPIEIFDYPGTGHLFTDPSLPPEYDEQTRSLRWERALAFCRSPQRAPIEKGVPGGSDQGHRLAR